MRRFLESIIAFIFLSLLCLPMLIIALCVRLSSNGPVLYWSERVGACNKLFNMPKFRTMNICTPVVATHLLKEPDQYLTRLGLFLRKYSLDELPQLWCVLKGDMGFVGPRPALFNQDDLVSLRTSKGVYKLRPGITGWAQVNGRDELSVAEKVEYDEYYAANRSNLVDLKILFRTLLSVVKCDGVSH